MIQNRLERLKNCKPAILPSLLQCDFGDLRGEVQHLREAGVEVLHLDVMDGQFVPNLTYGMPIVAGLKKHTDMFLDAHLMIQEPAAYVDAFADAGADMITFHIEAVGGPLQAIEVLKQIRGRGLVAGLALNPKTALHDLDQAIPYADGVLVMSVPAGFGGQPFDPVAVDKLRLLRKSHPELLLQVDGGINADTIGDCHAAGCDLFVVGSAIFGIDDYSAAVRRLRAALQASSSTL